MLRIPPAHEAAVQSEVDGCCDFCNHRQPSRIVFGRSRFESRLTPWRSCSRSLRQSFAASQATVRADRHLDTIMTRSDYDAFEGEYDNTDVLRIHHLATGGGRDGGSSAERTAPVLGDGSGRSRTGRQITSHQAARIHPRWRKAASSRHFASKKPGIVVPSTPNCSSARSQPLETSFRYAFIYSEDVNSTSPEAS